jgi:hypothetical protein
VGELGLFTTCAVLAGSRASGRATQVLALSSTALQQLRAAESPVYDALLRHALVTAANRCRNLDREIAQVRQGNFAAPPVREQAGFLARLWSRVRKPDPHATACAPLDELLARHPVLAHASESVRAALVAAFVARPFRRGDVLCRQDEQDDKVYVLAAGKADVLRELEASGAALLLSRFEPGTIFGVHTFAEGVPRTASVVATEDGWLYTMDRAAFLLLPREPRTVWIEAMVAVLAGQCQAAGHALQTAIHAFATRHPAMLPSQVNVPVEDAWGALQGLRPGDAVAGVARHGGKKRR